MKTLEVQGLYVCYSWQNVDTQIMVSRSSTAKGTHPCLSWDWWHTPPTLPTYNIGFVHKQPHQAKMA